MSRSLEDFEFESVITAVIAALSESDDPSSKYLKHKINSLELPRLLKMEHEHEATDELIEKCLKEVNEFYGYD